MPSKQGREREYQVSSIGQRLGGAGSGIGYDRTGWDGRTGGLKPLAIVFARDVELDLERVIRTERGWRVRFRGPQARRWREGVQALFVAVVPQQFPAAESTPWKLHSIR